MALTYSVSYLAVILSAVAGFLVSWIWWGPIFGKKWGDLMGFGKAEMKKAKEKGMAGPMIVMIVANIIMAYVLSMLLMATGVATMSAALMLGFWLWLGLIATLQIGVVLWQNKPMSLFWINSIGWLITTLVMVAVLQAF